MTYLLYKWYKTKNETLYLHLQMDSAIYIILCTYRKNKAKQVNMDYIAVIFNIYYYYNHNNKESRQTVHNYKNYHEEMDPKVKYVD